MITCQTIKHKAREPAKSQIMWFQFKASLGWHVWCRGTGSLFVELHCARNCQQTLWRFLLLFSDMWLDSK